MAIVTLELDAFVRDLPETPEGQRVSGTMKRLVTFTVSLAAHNEEVVLDAVLVGPQGLPLQVIQVLRDDLNLPPEKAKALAQAIYEGHYTVEDNRRSLRQSRLTGELNVEPYWEAILRERLAPAS